MKTMDIHFEIIFNSDDEKSLKCKKSLAQLNNDANNNIYIYFFLKSTNTNKLFLIVRK